MSSTSALTQYLHSIDHDTFEPCTKEELEKYKACQHAGSSCKMKVRNGGREFICHRCEESCVEHSQNMNSMYGWNS